MPEADFSEALGRLLTDGPLRDRFAVDPDAAIASLGANGLVRAQLVALKIEQLEVQAEILLRKRFDAIRRLVPDFIARLETKAWPLFRHYARACWHPAPQDALEFAEFAQAGNRETNRLRFALRDSGRVRLHVLRQGRALPALQILVRPSKSKWREFMFSLRL